MTTSEHKSGKSSAIVTPTRARDVSFGVDTLVVDLEDGRRISVPIAWFPRLVAASGEQRSNWRLIGGGIGIHWPDIDEDISVENLLANRSELLTYRNIHASPGARAAEQTVPRSRSGRKRTLRGAVDAALQTPRRINLKTGRPEPPPTPPPTTS